MFVDVKIQNYSSGGVKHILTVMGIFTYFFGQIYVNVICMPIHFNDFICTIGSLLYLIGVINMINS